MKIEKKEIDDLSLKIAVEIEPSDYEADFKSEIKKLKNKVALKGFRKGKTPDRVIKQMYGVKILSDVVGEKLQKSIFDYIEEEKLDILGSPIRTDDNDYFEPNVKEMVNYKFNFEVGLAPEFDVQGVSEKDEYEWLAIEVTNEMVENDFENIKKRNAKRESVEPGDLDDEDLITIEAKELDGKKLKENGWETVFDVLVKDVVDKKVKKAIGKAKKDEKFAFDVEKLEDKDEKFVRKYLLKLEDDDDREVGNMFEGEIKEVQRLAPVELNQEFYDHVFGKDAVKDENEAKDFIRKELEKYYEQQSSNYLDNVLMERMMEETEVELPKEFLKKWLVQVENKTEDEVNSFFDGFAKDMKWNLINTKLSKEYGVKVEMEDVKDRFRAQVQSYFGMSAPDGANEYMEQIVDNLMSNKEQVNKAYQEAQVTKTFEKIKETIKTKEKPLSVDAFKELVEKLNNTKK